MKKGWGGDNGIIIAICIDSEFRREA